MSGLADSRDQATNEHLFDTITSRMNRTNVAVSSLTHALDDAVRPDIPPTRTVLTASVLRIEGPEDDPGARIEVDVKTSKATAVRRPATWAKVVLRCRGQDGEEDGSAKGNQMDEFAQVKMRTMHYYEPS